MQRTETLIIGGGLAGLSAAVTLSRGGRAFELIEATDQVGGRVRTDTIDGFQLDRGFQVLLTAYPTCRQLLDYQSLDLRRFEPGALIRTGGRWHRLGDPWRRPTTTWSTLINPAGSLLDKLRIAKVRHAACKGALSDVYHRPDMPTIDYLRQCGFSERMIDRFFRPFLGGVYLEPELRTSRRMFDFVFRMFANGDVAVPSAGMQAIPNQLAQTAGNDRIHRRTTAVAVDGDTVRLSDGRQIMADNIIVATTANDAAALFPSLRSDTAPTDSIPTDSVSTDWNQTLNLNFAVAKGVGRSDHIAAGRTLLLRGDEPDGIQTATILSGVASTYAPQDQHLVSCSFPVAKDQDVAEVSIDRKIDAAKSQLSDWLKLAPGDLRFVRAYPIRYGLPSRPLQPVQQPIDPACLQNAAPDCPAVYLVGDHRATPSIEGAMSTGQSAAAAILRRPVNQ